MYQGAFRELKAFYLKNVVRRQIKYIDAGEAIPNINMLESILILVSSWDVVF